MAELKPEDQPALTVVMPVYNALPYLDEAIASVLAQTHRDFVFAIYDDHSSDGSYEAALAWAARDSRIRVVRGNTRLGPCASSNAAARLAESDIVVRMDADDIAAPRRLEIQAAVLRERPDAVLVGSTYDLIDAAGTVLRKPTPGRILGSAPPFAHPSIAYRRAAFEAVGGYQNNTDYFEDFDLYQRLAGVGKLLVVMAPLISMRFAGQHARLRDDRDEVLRKIDRLYNDGPIEGPSHRKVSAMAYYSVAVLSILALQRPRMFGEMLRRASFRRPARALSVLGIVGVAELSPRLARFLGHLASDLREYLAARRLGREPVLEWAPPR